MSYSRLREAIRLGAVDPWACSKVWGGGKSPSPPPAPDYPAAAVATAAGNKDAAIAAQQGSMVNQYTPYGNLTYNQSGTSSQGNPTYSANIDLSPTGQTLLNNMNNTQIGLSNLQQGAEQQVANQGPMDTSSVNDIYNQSYGLNTARLDPQWADNAKMEDSKLANQGIMQGSDAYNSDMRNFNQAKNDAYSQAQQAAIATMPQTYQLASAAYNQPLNRLNALTTGSQVTNPQFGNTPQQQAVAGPNYLGAAQATGQYNQGLYNTQVGQQNSFNSGLASLGSAGLSAAATYFSDRHLKTNIKRIGTHPLGIGIYEYDIFGKREIGVMAQEVLTVKPECVLTHPSGFLMVNYGGL